MPSCALYMTSYPPFKTTTISIYDITCPLLMISHALYMTCHLLCMISHSLYVWHHTCLYLWHCILYVYDISTLYGITHSVMSTLKLCIFTATMSDITHTVSVSSHPVYQFYHTQCMCEITATRCVTSYALPETSRSQFRISQHFMYVIRCTLSDLTSTVSLSSHSPYWWYHSHYMYDLTSSISATSHPLYLWKNIH